MFQNEFIEICDINNSIAFQEKSFFDRFKVFVCAVKFTT